MSRIHRLLIILIVLVLMAWIDGRLMSCGLDWQVPQNHFDGVNEEGYVSYWEKAGELDLGEDLKIPLIINFRSDYEYESPYLGYGWILYPIESSFVQVASDHYVMMQPDGLINHFWRTKAGKIHLKGQAGWMAEVKEEEANAWASCGWKVKYVKGRIVRISTPKGRELDMLYAGNKVTEIRERGAIKLSFEYEKDVCKAIVMGMNRIVLEMGKKPRVEETEEGKRVIGVLDKSLANIKNESQKEKKFEFEVDKELNPTFKINDEKNTERLIVWDPKTRLIKEDGGWKYDIAPGKQRYANAAISRTNEKGENEYWFKDNAKGQETILAADGNKTITTWFTNGKLAGKIRKMNIVDSKNEITYLLEIKYNSKGLKREQNINGVITKFGENEKPLLIEKGDKIWQYVYDSNDNLKQIINEKNKTIINYEN